MKAISLWQPWASLVALGEKEFETRSWLTTYRGPIAIHAAKKKWSRELVDTNSMYFLSNVLVDNGYNDPNDLPKGCFVALAELTEIYTTDQAWNLASYQERALGNYVPGRFAWRLANVRQIEPVPFIGRQGLWQIGDDLVSVLETKVLKCKTS